MPKILWMSPYSLLDKSSGASINALQMLQYLQRCGYEVWSCSAFCCDNPSGAQEMFSKLHINPQENRQPLYSITQDGIRYFFANSHSTQEYEMTIEECQLFLKIYLKVLDEFQPDFVIGYGLSPLPILCRYEAQRRGIAIIQFIFNGEQRGFNFPCIDLALTDSFATTDYYAEHSLLNIKSTGVFCNKDAFIAPVRKPQFVTMINPSPNKGVSIFAKLVSVCEKRYPDIKFLVIESRAKFYQVMEVLHRKDNDQEFPFKGHHFINLQVLPLQSNMQNVYAVTSVLVVPSLWFESWGRVNTEAVFNHIPVISTTSGGIRESFAGAGISLEAPQHCREDYFSIPSDEEIEPWLDALHELLHSNLDKQFNFATKLHSFKTSYLRLSNLLHQLRPDLVPENTLKIPFDYERFNRLYAPQALSLDSSVATSLPQRLLLNADNSTRTDELNSTTSAGVLSLQSTPPQQETELEFMPCSAQSSVDSSSSSSTPVISAGYTLSPEALMPCQPEHFDQSFIAALNSDNIAMPQLQADKTNQSNQDNAPSPTENNSSSCDSSSTMDATNQANTWAQQCNELDLNELLTSFQSA